MSESNSGGCDFLSGKRHTDTTKGTIQADTAKPISRAANRMVAPFTVTISGIPVPSKFFDRAPRHPQASPRGRVKRKILARAVWLGGSHVTSPAATAIDSRKKYFFGCIAAVLIGFTHARVRHSARCRGRCARL